MVRIMNDYIDVIIKNKLKYLSHINVEDYVCLTNIDDIISYGYFNPNCYFGQFVTTHDNREDKYYIMVSSNELNAFGKHFYPICISDLVDNGAFTYKGHYAIYPRIGNITSTCYFNLSEDIKYYKLFVNNNCITNDFIFITDSFVTAPLMFSSKNNVILYCYDDNKKFIEKLRLINTIETNNLISGVLTSYIK